MIDTAPCQLILDGSERNVRICVLEKKKKSITVRFLFSPFGKINTSTRWQTARLSRPQLYQWWSTLPLFQMDRLLVSKVTALTAICDGVCMCACVRKHEREVSILCAQTFVAVHIYMEYGGDCGTRLYSLQCLSHCIWIIRVCLYKADTWKYVGL